MSVPLALPYVVLALVLLLSGAAKLADRRATEDMFVSLRVPLLPGATGALLLPWGEIVLAVALLVVPAPAVVVPAVLTLLLFLAYWALIARALTFDPPVSCACFGKLGGHRVGGSTLVRNTLLVGLAVLALVASLRDVDVVDGVRDATTSDALWLALTILTAMVVWLVARTDPDETSMLEAAPHGGEEGDYERLRIPYGVVAQSDGTTKTLRELATLQARLLVFISQGCGTCVRTAQRLDGWADDLDGVIAVHAVYKALPDAGDHLLHRVELVLHEPDANVSRVFGSISTPQAVLLGTDGLLAGGPVVGEDEIELMVSDLKEQLQEAAG